MQLLIEETGTAVIKTHHSQIRLRTSGCMEFVDLTKQIEKLVAKSGIRHGIANIQTRHTTTAVIVNEHEPLLIEDLKQHLERLVPCEGEYQHNDFSKRRDIPPDEPANGHSHCKALYLPTAVSINIVDGVLQLGTWQSIFFIELDDSRDRTISVMVFGQSGN